MSKKKKTYPLTIETLDRAENFAVKDVGDDTLILNVFPFPTCIAKHNTVASHQQNFNINAIWLSKSKW